MGIFNSQLWRRVCAAVDRKPLWAGSHQANLKYHIFVISLLQMAKSCLITSHAHQRFQYPAGFTLYSMNQTVVLWNCMTICVEFRSHGSPT